MILPNFKVFFLLVNFHTVRIYGMFFKAIFSAEGEKGSAEILKGKIESKKKEENKNAGRRLRRKEKRIK